MAFLQILGLVALSFATAFLALWMIAFRLQSLRKQSRGFMDHRPEQTVFLFDDQKLVDASSRAAEILDAAPRRMSDWEKMLSTLSVRYADLGEALESLPETMSFRINASAGESYVIGEWHQGLVRLAVNGGQDMPTGAQLDAHSLHAMEEEIESLRAVSQDAPFLVWRQRSDGTIVWANATYLALARDCDPDRELTSWPPPRLFDVAQFNVGDAQKSLRLTLHVPGKSDPQWFDCQTSQLGSDDLFTAISADGIVHAETALRDFVQTLTKTFAHLTVGLVIFDKNRKLSLFNPALSDLTSLNPEFLAARPSLQEFLDRLREKRMIPEPKNYKSWRQKLHDLEAAAVEGRYEETWSLASGQTYRVVGRPHPDGAVAFLIEDISAEILLTRRYRAELETGQAVLDSFDEAIAVFAANGELTLANAAYGRMWGDDPLENLADHGVIDASRIWASKCAPTPVWGDVREFVGGFAERSEWTAQVQARDGQQLSCRFLPLPGGATLVGFTLSGAVRLPAPVRPDRQPGIADGTLVS